MAFLWTVKQYLIKFKNEYPWDVLANSVMKKFECTSIKRNCMDVFQKLIKIAKQTFRINGV